MDKQYLQHLTDTLTDKDNLKQCREEAASFHKNHTASECFDMACEFGRTVHILRIILKKPLKIIYKNALTLSCLKVYT